MAKFVRAVFPMLIVLRLADQKEPVMDKLYFYVRRMDKTLNQSKIILDDLQHNTHEISWRLLSMIKDDESNDYDDSEASMKTTTILIVRQTMKPVWVRRLSIFGTNGVINSSMTLLLLVGCYHPSQISLRTLLPI